MKLLDNTCAIIEKLAKPHSIPICDGLCIFIKIWIKDWNSADFMPRQQTQRELRLCIDTKAQLTLGYTPEMLYTMHSEVAPFALGALAFNWYFPGVRFSKLSDMS